MEVKIILDKLKELEKKEGIKILLAVESGSREWGFASEDSDYDIRCVHIRKKEDYLSLEEKKEQSDLMDGDLDIVSWDVRKFFKLFLNSNPTVSEWLSSKIVYLDVGFFGKFQKDLREIFKEGFSREKLEKHYLSLARQNYEKYINSTAEEVSLKKYVYILRALGCIEYIKNTNKLPPLNWKESCIYLPKKIQTKFARLVEIKKSSEKNKGKRDRELDIFISSKFEEEFLRDNEKFDKESIDKISKKSILRGFNF